MGDFWNKIVLWFESTKVQEQIKEVDAAGLFSNPWFMVPFVAMIAWMIWKQSFRDLVIITIFVAVWWVTGTEYMHSLTVNGELQMNKVLPVLFGGAIALGVIVYLLFGRSD
ncbi:MAG: hypothetical protein ABFS19_12870 [Thermodesulfobacteriota bacterium]